MGVIMKYRWVILGLVVYCQLAQAITYQGIPPILGLLVTGLGISYAQAGGLMSLYSLPRIFMETQCYTDITHASAPRE